MQKKILSAVLSLFLVAYASSAFADGYWTPSLDVEIEDSFNRSVEIEIDIEDVDDVEIEDSFNTRFDNDVFDVNNDDGMVLNQLSNVHLGYVGGSRRGGLPTQLANGNIAVQVNSVEGLEGGIMAIGNSLSINGSFNSPRTTTTTISTDIDVEVDDSFNDNFNHRGGYGGPQ